MMKAAVLARGLLITLAVVLLLSGCSGKDIVSLSRISKENLTVSDRYGNSVRVPNGDDFINAMKKAQPVSDGRSSDPGQADYVISSGSTQVYYNSRDKVLIFVDTNQKKTLYSADLDSLLSRIPGLVPRLSVGPSSELRAVIDPEELAKVPEPAAAVFKLADKSIVFVSAGQRPTGGYALRLEKATVSNNMLVLTVRLSEPNGPVTQVVTYPYIEIATPPGLDIEVRLVSVSSGAEQVQRLGTGSVSPGQNIILFKPERGALLTESVRMFGYAKVSSNQFGVEIEDGHYVLGTATVRVTPGQSGWGYFDFRMNISPATNPYGAVIFTTRSPKDGSRVEELLVPVAFGGK